MPKKTTAKRNKTAKKKTAPKPARNFSLKAKISKPQTRLKSPKKAITISVIVFILALIAAWWQFIFADPSKVLSDMLAGNLRTPGIVKEVRQGGGQNTITQRTYLSFVDGPRSQSLTTLEQQTAAGMNRVVTENVGTLDEDYIRYRTIDVTSAGGPAGQSPAENIWASRSQDSGQLGQQASFLNEGLFSLVAFGNFDKVQADKLEDTINEADVYNYSAVQRGFEGGRLVYRYQVELQPKALIGYLAEYSQLVGVDHKGQLDTSNYADAQPVQATFSVDVLSRELKSIEYANTGRVEQFSGYGLKRAIDVPSGVISISGLQRLLQPSR